MDLMQAIVLGAVQGLAEFLPISSSGHLIMVPYLLGWDEHSQAFDLALHLGTTVALFGFFWREFLALARGFLLGLTSPERRRTDPYWRMALLVLLGSVPAGVVGVLFEKPIEALVRGAVINAVLLIVFGGLLWWADATSRLTRRLGDLGWRDALLVGLAQALALLPGVSRSGITLTAGLMRGLDREAAARFSFLLSGPITLAAVIFKLRDGVPSSELQVVVAGTATSAVVGWMSIGFLLRYLQRNSTLPFVLYRVAFGLLVLGVALRR